MGGGRAADVRAPAETAADDALRLADTHLDRASASAGPVPGPGQCRAQASVSAGPVPGQCRARASAGPVPMPGQCRASATETIAQ
jgi:hypothetical protein